VSSQRGGGSKDTWVLADGPVPYTTLIDRVTRPSDVSRASFAITSRVADNLFWLGRNVERLDNGGRLLRAGLQRVVAGFGGPREFVETASVIRVLARCGVFGDDVAAALPDGMLPAQALVHAFAPGKHMDETFQKIERLAASVRDRFSVDMWRTINHLLGDLRGRLDWAGGNADRMLDLLDDLVRVSSALSGMASENMTRGSGWRFLDMGRRVERAIYVARTLLGVGDTAAANWDASLHLALELCDSTITYRTRYLAALQAAPVLDLLLLDDTNPQSLAFQLAAIRQHLLELPARNAGPVGRETLVPLDLIGEAVALFDRDDLRGAAITEAIEEMRAQLTRTEAALQTFSDEITRAYFSHVQPARAFGYR
jgi:uncharacterized alpha-E superfamily protein